MNKEIAVVDIETENIGADIIADNKRIISVQIGDDCKQELYYADAIETTKTLSAVCTRINELITRNVSLAGYNLRGFDLLFLKKFLGVEIPEGNILELGEMDDITAMRQRNGGKFFRLEQLCKEYGIPCQHKQLMDERAAQFRAKPDVLSLANSAARKLVAEKGWGFDFSARYALDKIAGGRAILDSYNEFVRTGGSAKTLFHAYAIGDVVCEYQLLRALLRNK